MYVHVPFCLRRCDYCAFATWTDRDDLMAAYVEACLVQMSTDAGQLPRAGATSVYVGGGTPSRLPPRLLGRLVAAVPRAAGAEVTVECNPADVNEELVACLADAGVTRVSLGVQSTHAHVLASLGRDQSPATALQAVAQVGAAGFESFGCDLIYGGAGESLGDWRATLDAVLACTPVPPHVSAYALTVEAGTPLAASPRRHPDSDDQAEKYALADEVFSAAGLSAYEISNWSRPGHQCRHNLLYWEQGSYLGIGCAAHSHLERRRSWNVRSPERYMALAMAGQSPVVGSEQLTDDQYRLEGLLLALRTASGVPADALDLDGLDDLVAPTVDDRVVLTRRGRLLANEVALRLRPRGR